MFTLFLVFVVFGLRVSEHLHCLCWMGFVGKEMKGNERRVCVFLTLYSFQCAVFSSLTMSAGWLVFMVPGLMQINYSVITSVVVVGSR